MPLYEYVCEDCQHPFEALVYGANEPECPGCNGKKLARQLSLPAQPKAESSMPMSSMPAGLPSACRSSGPPCGPVCGRWQQN